MRVNYERELKNIYPDAVPYMGVMGWGIQTTDTVLAIARFKTLEAAWRTAWRHAYQTARVEKNYAHE